MMLRWPGKVEPGRVTNDIVAIHDFMPTFAAIVGEELPDDRSYDGLNQLPFLTGEATGRRGMRCCFSTTQR